MAKILIVDDEETIRKLLSSALQRQGHEVVCVEDGYRACDVYPVFQPKVIISDIKMPDKTGYDVFAKAVDTDPAEFRRATEVTYLGTVYGTMAALRRMTPRLRVERTPVTECGYMNRASADPRASEA